MDLVRGAESVPGASFNLSCRGGADYGGGATSAYVLFFHTTIGQVPMSNAGGNTWTATLGPYSGIGDGSADYQIHAVDTLGNASDSSFAQVTVLAYIP